MCLLPKITNVINNGTKNNDTNISGGRKNVCMKQAKSFLAKKYTISNIGKPKIAK